MCLFVALERPRMVGVKQASVDLRVDQREPDGVDGDAAGLVAVVQELSLARTFDAIAAIVRRAGRELTGADGASLVLREGDCCYYVEESAIAPLWKGRRFPMSACISGWVMTHGEAVAIEDVYDDPRIPSSVYAPTFVKSMAMVPIRRRAPIGAIGNYWRDHHRPEPYELALLQALADSTAVAMENVAVYAELERRVRDRTLELEVANRELAAKHDAIMELQHQREALSSLVVHDLKSPAGAIMLAASMHLQRCNERDPARRAWSRVLSSAEQIHRTALNLLDISACDEGKLIVRPADVDIAELFGEIAELVGPQAERRGTTIEIDVALPRAVVRADHGLLRRVLQNLLDNAVRHTPANGTV
ncbi:MAG: Osmosensitive channel histidine kinase KdpD, partial [Labilithrix sp.]|nr:Osmosensitive channel histidine kinase KdpD [Labilithrix sp.]